MNPRARHIFEELREHFPYTILAAAIGVGFLGLITFVATLTNRQAVLPEASQGLFHLTHFTHLFFSAIATTSMFWRHERRWLKAFQVGLWGTVLPCGTSDVLFPFVGGRFLGVPMELHICILEHPLFVLPFLLGGIGVGFLLPPIQRSTIFSHTAHVILSSTASMLYLVSFGVADWLRFIALVFLLLVAAVMVPCCTSDIVFPLLFTRHEEERPRAIHRAV